MSNDTQEVRKFAVTITLKSGVQLQAECDSFKAQRNLLHALVGVEWENLSAQWLHIDVEEIAAIVVEPIGATA